MTKFFTVLFSISFFFSMAQNNLGIWEDHIPQSTIYDIVKVDAKVFCATDIGLFIFDETDNSITTYSKLNGLSDIGIRALAYDHKRAQLIMGYKNGNIDVFDGENITNLNDIVRSSKFVGKKRVNHIKIYNDVAYLSTGFGIIELDLDKFVVLNTLIIGDNSKEIEVFETDVDDATQTIYAATEEALMFADITKPLIFFSFWNEVSGLPNGIYNQVDIFGNFVFTNRTLNSKDDSVYYFDGNNWQIFADQIIGNKTDIRVSDGILSIVNTFLATSYNENLAKVMQIGNAFFPPGTYFPRVAWPEKNGNILFIGNNKYGLIKSEDVSINSRILPDGPFSSEVYTLNAMNNTMYVASGSIDEVWNSKFKADGIFTYADFQWSHITAEDLGGAGDIVLVTEDPLNADKIWANAWGTGILEIEDGKIVETWDDVTTGGILKTAAGTGGGDIRTGGLTFDEKGNMWMTNSLTTTPLVVRYKDGTWANFGFGSLSSGSIAFKDMFINELGQYWMQTRLTGLVVAEINNGNAIARGIRAGVGKGNLPEDQVLSFAEDLDGEIWIGTIQGLVVLYSPQNIFTNKNFDAQPVLFEEDGVVQRLLGTEQITAIAIDGANKKWFGTQNSGVFYTSEDGTETIYHFTSENSPLLSNGILDITINQQTGEVFFGTVEGIVSFRGAATAGNETFTNVYAYPNPVRPEHNGPIFIRGLATNAQVKITDVQGNIVYETVAEGGQAIWYGTNLSGDKVSSGVYVAYLNNDDGTLTAVTKILIIR